MSRREAEMSIAVSELFPGFRFCPTDVELICYYLRRKIAGEESSAAVIAEVEIYKFEPWDLPGQSVLKSESEWFFFCARGRKYQHGTQSRRGTELGYWKATGKERNVKSGSHVVGTKRTLVFHIGRAPRGERTEWIMHEYCMNGAPQDALVVCRLRRNNDFHASSRQRQMQDGMYGHNPNMSNDIVSHTGASEGENKTMESHSESNSEQKLSNDTNAESSNYGPPNNGGDEDEEDDCYAEILNDDIIKLEETTPRNPRRGEPSSRPCLVSQALQSVPCLRRTVSAGASVNCVPNYSTARASDSRCLLCFRVKDAGVWRLRDVSVVLAVLALVISGFLTVSSV